MTKKDIKLQQIAELKQKYGNDFFKKGVFSIPLSSKTELATMATVVGYRRPKDSYVSLGGAYYEHLMKIANS